MFKSLILSTLLSCAVGVGSLSFVQTPNRAYEPEDLTYAFIDANNISVFTGYNYNYYGSSILIPAQTSKPSTFQYTSVGFLNNSFGNGLKFDYYGVWGTSQINTDTTNWSYQSFQNLSITNNLGFEWTEDDNLYTGIAFPIFQYGTSQNNYLNVYLYQSNVGLVLSRHGQWNIPNYNIFLNVELYYTDSGTYADFFHKVYNNITISSNTLEDNFYYFNWNVGPVNELEPLFPNFQYHISIYVGATDTYQSGYTDGYQDGYDNGEQYGYNQGLTDAMDGTLVSMFMSIADIPILMLRSMFDFNVLGISIFSLLMGLITILIAVFIIKKII